MRTSGAILLAMVFGGAGFAAGYLVSRQKYYNLADKEVQSMKDMIPEHDANLLAAYGVDTTKVKPDYKLKPQYTQKTSATITPEVMVSEHKDRIEEELKSKPLNKTNYANIAKQYQSQENEMPKKVTTLTKKLPSCEIISEDTANLADEYPTDIIFYTDGIFADIDDNAVTNASHLIGDLTMVLEELKVSGVVYVRNLSTKQIFCIQKSERKWREIASDEQKKAILDLDRESDVD